MAATTPYGAKTQRPPAVKEVHVVWMTSGLGCDGDSVSITAAEQPSVEDVVLGAGAHRLDRLGFVAMAAEDDDRHVGPQFLHALERLEPARVGQPQIEQDRVERLEPEPAEGVAEERNPHQIDRPRPLVSHLLANQASIGGRVFHEQNSHDRTSRPAIGPSLARCEGYGPGRAIRSAAVQDP